MQYFENCGASIGVGGSIICHMAGLGDHSEWVPMVFVGVEIIQSRTNPISYPFAVYILISSILFAHLPTAISNVFRSSVEKPLGLEAST